MSKEALTVAVGSLNPVKIDAVKKGFSKVWPEIVWHVSGVSVSSGISVQPMSDVESIQGATNRANTARTLANSDYGVGLEGGVQEINGLWFDCGWAAVVNRKGIVGLGSSARIIVPPSFIPRLKAGEELGFVLDDVYHETNLKQGKGHFGVMTNGAIDRTSAYVDGVISALARFLHPELFSE